MSPFALRSVVRLIGSVSSGLHPGVSSAEERGESWPAAPAVGAEDVAPADV